MNISFQGKRALVTGAGKGIGRALSLRLSDLGADVVAVSRTQDDLDGLTALSPRISGVCCDVGDWEATRRALSDVGPVDLLVNNAGIMPVVPYGHYDQDTIDSMFNVNVKAAINVMQAVLEGMKSRGGGRVVNVSSIASLATAPGFGAYGATKAALDLLTRSMALELGPHNIRVNSVNPTAVRTRLAEGYFEEGNAFGGALLARTPLGRFCEPSDVVDPILFLLSDLSSMVTGAILPIDGGITLAM